ncbi:hypothetical protein CDAR_69841, partial [Caerostris darwini]
MDLLGVNHGSESFTVGEGGRLLRESSNLRDRNPGTSARE